ncbi:MAG: hypothetical protein K2N74_04265 [Clostridiales bacterium]|nr:hypothetical protein [Clostridiales bacterium]
MLYSGKSVRALVARLKEEYEGVVRAQKAVSDALKQENSALRARISQLEGERGNVSTALVHATAEGERIKDEMLKTCENERKELKLLADKCRLLTDRLTQKYPDEEDVSDFDAFLTALKKQLGEETEEEESNGFNIDDVLAPKKPLDLGKLCRELGLMEEDE